MGSSSFISLLSGLLISWLFLKLLLRLDVFLVKIWLAFDFENTNLPVPVFLKRFAAALLVLIFGIVFLLHARAYLSRNKERGRNNFPNYASQLQAAFV